jgi:hypothetical protein
MITIGNIHNKLLMDFGLALFFITSLQDILLIVQIAKQTGIDSYIRKDNGRLFAIYLVNEFIFYVFQHPKTIAETDSIFLLYLRVSHR